MLPQASLPGDGLSSGGGWFVRRNPVMVAAPGTISDLLRVMGVSQDVTQREPALTLPVWRVRSGAVLLHEGAVADFLQVVRSGTFKSLRTLEDGYEQVLSFAGPGDVLGFDALCSGHHASSVVALEDSTVFAVPLRELDHWRQHCTPLDQALQFALSRQLARAGQVAEMMAPVASEVRLARFLVWQSVSMAERGESPRRLYLRMSRRDIASLLGVAHETVSRSFTALVDWGCLRVDNREVEILDADRLRACAHNTRGFPDELARGEVAGARRRGTCSSNLANARSAHRELDATRPA